MTSIPLCVFVCVCVYNILFIHSSSVDGHLGRFYILAIINNAAMNIVVHVSFQNSVFVFLDIYPGVEFLGHIVVLFLVFWETSILFSIVAVSIYILTNSVQGFPSLHILTDICYLCLFDDSHSDKCEVISHCSFDLHFPDD